MLVLNTESSTIRTSSQSLDGGNTYPDFSQILIKPSFWRGIASAPRAIEEVKWTHIHNYSSEIREDTRNYAPNLVWQWCDASIWWNVSSNIVVASLKSIPAGKIIWKEVIYAGVFWSWTINDYLSLRAWLLHTDWTITYLTEEKKLYEPSWSYPYLKFPNWAANAWLAICQYQRVFERVITRGFISKEWDRLIVVVGWKCTNSSNKVSYIWFWNDSWWALIGHRYSSSPEVTPWIQCPCTPIQISIE